MNTGQRREREMAHARTDILDAAVRAFTRAGLHSTTMQDIAREAGYTAASLYTYFKSKQEIVEAMINRLTDEFVGVFDEPMPSGLNFRQRFELISHRLLEVANRQQNAFNSFLGAESMDTPCPGGENSRAFHSNFERRIQRLAQWLRDNAETEDLGNFDPEIAARLLFGMGFGLFHQCERTAEKKSLTEYAPIIIEFFFHGISGKPKTGARKK